MKSSFHSQTILEHSLLEISTTVVRAVGIVQRLLAYSDFFVKTHGTVLNEISQHYEMAELSHEEIWDIRSKILPIRLIKGISCKESVYMQCFPSLKRIHIEANASAFSCCKC